MKQRKFKSYIKTSFIKYSIIVILIILGVFLVSLYVIFDTSVVKANKSLNKELQLIVNDEFTSFKKELKELAQDLEIKQMIQSTAHSSELIQILYELRNKGKFNANFILLDKNRDIISSSFYLHTKEVITDHFLFNNIIDQLEDKSYVEQSVSNFLDSTAKSMYYFGVNITEQEKNIGYLVFFLDDLVFNTEYNQTIYITDEYHNVIFNTNNLGIDRLGKLGIDTSKKFKKINNDYFFIDKHITADQSVHIVTMTPINTYRFLLIYGVISMFIVGLIIILIVYIVSPKILHKTLQPFDVLMSAISKENQNLAESNDINEFQTIYTEYNSKIEKIQKLIKINKEITEKKRKMEIKHLEAKFNPHFLYNVLEMLKYEVTLDPESASNIIVKIAKLMRYNTNFGSTAVPLHIDIENLNDYISLQKMRYGDRLVFSSTIQPHLLHIKLPKLIIQPLIENAIKHNIDHVNELSIQLIIKQVKQKIIIEVIDNGIGIENGELQEIREIIINDEDISNHQGLRNTHNMIQLIYGEKFGLDIHSIINEHTVVRLSIPYDEENSFV